MLLRALTAGHTVPRQQFDGVVHSVFAQVCNLRLADGRLITLLTQDLGDLPQGIRLDTAAGFSFESLGLQPDQKVSGREGVMSITNSALKVDLRSAQPWQADLTQRPVDLGDPAVYQAFNAVWAQWSAFQPYTDELGKQLQGKIIGLTATLQEAISHDHLTNARETAASLLGLGSGLTPSGDDVLVGFLAGLWATAADHPDHRAFLGAFATSIVALAEGTNEISRSFLWHAAQGEVSSVLAELVQTIAEGKDSAVVRQAAEAALRVGHSSGWDSVRGLLAGLQTWPAFCTVTSRATT